MQCVHLITYLPTIDVPLQFIHLNCCWTECPRLSLLSSAKLEVSKMQRIWNIYVESLTKILKTAMEYFELHCKFVYKASVGLV